MSIYNVQKMHLALNVVADYYGLEPERIKTKTRARHISEKRQMFYYIAYKSWHGNKALTLTEIGGFIGYDHATVLHGIRKISELMNVEKALRREVDEISYRLAQINLKREKLREKHKAEFTDELVSLGFRMQEDLTLIKDSLNADCAIEEWRKGTILDAVERINRDVIELKAYSNEFKKQVKAQEV